MHSERSREGYLLLDHRDSPGVNPELERICGLPVGATKAGAFFESATRSCRHCQRQIVLNPDRSRERHRCRGCGYMCDACAAIYAIDGVCRNIERQFAEVLERAVHESMRTVHTGFATPLPPAEPAQTPTVYSTIALDAPSGDTTASQAILLP